MGEGNEGFGSLREVGLLELHTIKVLKIYKMNIFSWEDLKDHPLTKAKRNVLVIREPASLRNPEVITLHYPVLFHNLKRLRPSGHPTEHHSDELVYGIMLVSPDKKKVTSSLEDLVKDMHFKEWETKPMNIQELATSVDYLGIQGGMPDITSKVKDKLFHPTMHIKKKEVQHLVDPISF